MNLPMLFTLIYLKFPLLVKDRKKFFKEAEKEKIELGDWFVSPIHPEKF